MVIQRRPHHFPRVYTAGRQSPFEKGLDGNNTVFSVQEKHFELFPFFILHALIKIIEQRLGMMQRVSGDKALFQIALTNGRDQLDTEKIFGADTIDFAKFPWRRFKNGSQIAETPQCGFGRRFTVPAGRCQGQQKFQDFIVMKTA